MIYVLYESQICLHHEKGQTCCFSSVLLFLVCKNFCALCPLQLLEGKQRSTVLFSRVLEVSASYTNRAGQTENFSSMSSNAETLYCQFLPSNFQERANVLPSSAVLCQSFSGCFAHNLMKENTLQVFR